MRVLKYGIAYLRGIRLRLYFALFQKNCHCGKNVLVMKGAEVGARKGGSVYMATMPK